MERKKRCNNVFVKFGLKQLKTDRRMNRRKNIFFSLAENILTKVEECKNFVDDR